MLPQWPQEDLQAVEKNFHDIIRTILNGFAEDKRLRLPNLDILRELGEDVKVSMQVPGMYGVSLFLPNRPIGAAEFVARGSLSGSKATVWSQNPTPELWVALVRPTTSLHRR